MIHLDARLLDDVGLKRLPGWERNLLLEHLYDTLERRVGIRLADDMTDEQLDEFEAYIEADDEEGAFKWLETNFPHYQNIVDVEYKKLKDELISVAPTILARSRAQSTPASALEEQVQLPVRVDLTGDAASEQRPRSELTQGRRARR